MKENKPKQENRNKPNDIHFIEKSRRGAIKVLFGRSGIVIFLLLAQILGLIALFRFVDSLIPYVVSIILGFTMIMVIHVINTEHNTSVMLTWVIVIMLIPGFGGIFYIFILNDIGHRAIKERLEVIVKESKAEFIKQKSLMKKLQLSNKGLFNLGVYTEKTGGFPIYENSQIKYFPLGEYAFEEMLIKLKSAEKFIFLEYFIVDEGFMLEKILKILVDKVNEGVEVRFMYDGSCEFTLLPRSYLKKIENLGIKCKVFAPIHPFLSTQYNYRDHRKILVIDGNVAFTGGINLADEYINKRKVYGHWKDTAVEIQGKAVDSFTLMFLQMWNMSEKHRSYMTDAYKSKQTKQLEKGFALPFADAPLDNDKVGEMVYMDILNRAETYVYIMTPYLILDGEMLTSLQFAARRGIDVKLIMPHIPDKKLVFAQSRSHYKTLIKSGVKIYEYTPGFMHAKVFLSDSKKAVVGTINLDYRSLYHHFECGLYMEEVSAIVDIEADFKQTLNQCHKVTLDDIKKYNIVMTLVGKILKLFAPLM